VAIVIKSASFPPLPGEEDFRFDSDGFLKDISLWNEQIAHEVAQLERVKLDTSKLLVILTLRDYYLSNQKMPRLREFISLLRTKPGMAEINSALLHQWFPISFTLQTARIAGLPKPKRCM
jgi:tRNA 2-thiouridine synthesizing protein E